MFEFESEWEWMCDVLASRCCRCSCSSSSSSSSIVPSLLLLACLLELRGKVIAIFAPQFCLVIKYMEYRVANKQ